MSFKIQILPGERAFEARAGETLLDAALRQGIGLPHGCRNGRCGSCIVKLQRGDIQYPSGLIEALEGKPARTCLTCQAVAHSDLAIEIPPRQAAREIATRTLPCRLERKETLGHDLLRLWLKPPDQQPFEFLAGQYLSLILPDGREGAYSIASPPHENALIELHVRRAADSDFSCDLFDKLAERSILKIRGPLGKAHLREESAYPLILVGGGTGFAPLKSMIEHAIHIGLARPIQLYWGVKSRRDLYLADLPERWADQLHDFRFTPVLSEPDPDWSGRTGWVHEAVIADQADLAGFVIHLSGPPAMAEAARAAFVSRGARPGQMFSDAFPGDRDSDQGGI